MAFIRENNMVIWRFHDHWHRTDPDGIYVGIEEKLGWENARIANYVYDISATTLGKLASEVKERFDAKTIRVIGKADMPINRAALSLGAPGSRRHISALNQDGVQVVLIGEAPEWEAIEYVRDAISAGHKKAMIIMGHAISEEAGMEYCSQWLRQFINEIPVRFVPANEPFWSPE